MFSNMFKSTTAYVNPLRLYLGHRLTVLVSGLMCSGFHARTICVTPTGPHSRKVFGGFF